MPLHNAKRVAFLQLCNWVSSSDLADIKDLLDGEFFRNIISAIFEISFNAEQCDSVAAVSEIDIINIKELKTLPEADDAEAKNKIILEKFKFVQNFINERYKTHSENLISYSDCAQGNELELAKVTIFILSEVVRHYVHTKNKHLDTLAHLDVKVQEDLQQCFHIFIFERESLSKSKVEKVLSNHAKYKASSPSKSSFITPRRSCTSKYRMNSPSNEDIFTNSLLKSFFESPVFKKEDMLLKEKEIVKTRKNLHEEEIKCEDLQFELKDAKRKLKEKDKEIKKLKANRNKHECDDNSLKYEEEIKQLKDKCDRLEKNQKQREKEHECELSRLYATITSLRYAASVNGKRNSYSESGKTLEKLLIEKHMLCEKQSTKIEQFRLTVDKLEKDIQDKDKEIAELVEVIKRKDNELAELVEVIKCKDNKISELEKVLKIKNNDSTETSFDELHFDNLKSDSPGRGENMGMILEEENRTLRLKINQLEEQLQKFLMVQPEEIHVPDIKNAFNVSMPELLNKAEPPETQKMKDFKEHFKNDEELTGLPDDCDLSSNSEVASKHSAGSSHSEVKCLPDSPLTGNTPEPVLESYGTLWKNLENSQLESEHSDTFENLNEYSQGNMLNKSCCNCNKIYLESEIMKMARDHAIQLEIKDEKIDKLKANIETLQQNYMKEQETNMKEQETSKKIIEDLKTNLSKWYTKASEYKDSLLSERAKLKDYNDMRQKLKLTEINLERSEEMRKDEVDMLYRRISKKDKDIYLLQQQSKGDSWEIKNYRGRMEYLESQKNELAERLKMEEKKNDEKTQEVKKYIALQRDERFRKLAGHKPPLIEYHTGLTIDIHNESTLTGGALLSRSGLDFPCHDEADYLNQTSLADVNKSVKEDDRMGELRRRNSILPQHLKSTYPAENNLPHCSPGKFYGTQLDKTAKNGDPRGTAHQNVQISKKRKYPAWDPELATPPAKVRKSLIASTKIDQLIAIKQNKSIKKPKETKFS